MPALQPHVNVDGRAPETAAYPSWPDIRGRIGSQCSERDENRQASKEAQIWRALADESNEDERDRNLRP